MEPNAPEVKVVTAIPEPSVNTVRGEMNSFPPVAFPAMENDTGTPATFAPVLAVTVAFSFTVFTTPPVLGARLAELDSNFIWGAGPSGSDTNTFSAAVLELLVASVTSIVANPAVVQLKVAWNLPAAGLGLFSTLMPMPSKEPREAAN